MSALVDRAIAAAGLSNVLASRRERALDEPVVSELRRADLLALGALADRVRRDEVGDQVRIYAPPPDGDTGAILLPHDDSDLTGLELLREIAVARVTGPPSARVRIDWTRSGLELAQVGLGFGANELTGYLGSKRGLAFADGEVLGVGKRSRLQPAHVMKKKELAGFIRRMGRIPVFVGIDGSVEPVDDAMST